MKNGNLYKLAALLMVFTFVSGMCFAQEDETKEKSQTIIVKVNVDDDGNKTTDTIVFTQPDFDMDKIMKEVEVYMDISEDKMKEIRMEVVSSVEEVHDNIRFHMDESEDEMKETIEKLKEELKQLKIEESAQQRINEAMQKLEEMSERTEHHFNTFFMDDDQHVVVEKNGKMEVIVDEDGNEIKTEIIWVDEDGANHVGSGENYFFEKDGNTKVIIKKDGKVDHDDENVFVTNGTEVKTTMIVMDSDDENISFFGSSKSDDIDKAIEAGLPIDKDKMIKDLDVFVEISDDEEVEVQINTHEEGKLKATAYDKNFKKVKKVKTEQVEETGNFNLDFSDLAEENITFLLLEQNGKTELMKIKVSK